MTRVAGIDGYPKGWVAVVLEDGRFAAAAVGKGLGDLIGTLGDVTTIGLDIPIGLPERSLREADRHAKDFVGPRRNSVFMTPPRLVLEAPNPAEARRRCVALTGQSISSQALALRGRILEADAVAGADQRIREVHPEVSFRALAGVPLDYAKSTWAGIDLRRQLLADAGIVVPGKLGLAGSAGVDDVLDAAVAAWSAVRIAAGRGRSFPTDPRVGADGHSAAIWY
jgi:predicted RNase H-like nuclease